MPKVITALSPEEAQERGHRLNLAIHFTKHSLTTFAEKHPQLGLTSLYNWTRGKTCLTKRGAKFVAEAMKAEGYYCSEEWLLNGTGMPPATLEDYRHGKNSYLKSYSFSEEDQDLIILEEINFFQGIHSGAVTLLIEDDAMEPVFKAGDYIAGLEIKEEFWKDFLHIPCLVGLEGEVMLARTVSESRITGKYNLTGTNPRSKAHNFHLNELSIIKLAPIVWHRFHLDLIKNIALKGGLKNNRENHG